MTNNLKNSSITPENPDRSIGWEKDVMQTLGAKSDYEELIRFGRVRPKDIRDIFSLILKITLIGFVVVGVVFIILGFVFARIYG